MKTITIIAKEWFDKVNGNSYFAADCYVNNEHVARLPFQYGYGDHYQHMGAEELEKLGHLPGREHYHNGGAEALWAYCSRNNIKLLTHKSENCKKRDLK